MYSALCATSKTLSEFLLSSLRAAPLLHGFFPPLTVTLNNPVETHEGLSVWLYRIVRDEQTLNAPPRRTGPNSIMRTPLPFRLHYLITPLVNGKSGANHETEQRILGRVLQALYDHPIIRGSDLAGDFAGLADVELNTRLEPMNLEEITRVWDALDKPYKLSVSYEVSVVCIESGKELEQISQVETFMPEYGVIVSSEEV
jgi:hypothetical protein